MLKDYIIKILKSVNQKKDHVYSKIQTKGKMRKLIVNVNTNPGST